jgi:hypothetical protein
MSDAGAAYVFGPSSTGIGDEGSWDMPLSFQLNQNFPNPFNPTTVISYQLSVASDVMLGVYDMLGREVALLVNDRKNAGSYEVKFDASGLSSGIYLYRLNSVNYTQSHKMLLLR